MPSTPLQGRPPTLRTRADRIAAHVYALPVVRPVPRRGADLAEAMW